MRALHNTRHVRRSAACISSALLLAMLPAGCGSPAGDAVAPTPGGGGHSSAPARPGVVAGGEPFVSARQARRAIDVTAAALARDAATTLAAIVAGSAPFVAAGNPQPATLVVDTDGAVVAAPDATLVGTNLQGERDALGRTHRAQMVAGALARGDGSLEYAFADPAGGLGLRTAYYRLVTGSDGRQYVVCAERYVAPIDGAAASPAPGAAPTPADIRALAERAAAYARVNGTEPALRAFSDAAGEFNPQGLSVAAYDMNGVVLADGSDPSLVGADLGGMHDADGVAVMKRLTALAQEGSGWLYSGWPNLDKLGREEPRLTCVLRVDEEWFLTAGAFGPAAIKLPTRAEVKAFVDDAWAYVKAHGREKAFATFMDRNGPFARGELYVFADDFNCINLCFPIEPQTVGTSLRDRRDADGKYPVRAMAAVAREDGRGWVTYAYVNPAHGYQVERKLSYVRRAGDDWFLGAGTYELPD